MSVSAGGQDVFSSPVLSMYGIALNLLANPRELRAATTANSSGMSSVSLIGIIAMNFVALRQ